MILKGLSHSGLPKCIRILKTSNSIYFVWEYYSFTALQEYLEKHWMKIEESKIYF